MSEGIPATVSNPAIINATTNTGKALQLPVASTTKNLSQLITCKRSHINLNSTNIANNFNHLLDSSKLSIKCPNSSQPLLKNSNNSTHKVVSNTINNVKSVTTNPKEFSGSYAYSKIIKKESLSCDSISKVPYLYGNLLIGETNTTSPIQIQSIDTGSDEAIAIGSDQCSTEQIAQNASRSPLLDKPANNGSLLSVNSCGVSMFGSSGSSCGHNISTASTVTVCNSPMISLSKSETNICETNRSDGGGGGGGVSKLTIYNVVSLNDLNETDPFLSRPMNDLSKNQCLTKISDSDICELNQKKHVTALTNPTVLTSITVSMRNTADVSDKLF